MSTALRAGTARVDITPPLTIPYLGYVPRHAFFEGVHDPLYARALVIEDGATQAALIAADSIGYSNDLLGPGRHFTAELRQRVEAQCGIPAAHVMLAATHAHSTPETINLRRLLDHPAAGPWLETLLDQLASAVAMAARRRRAVALKAGTVEAEGIGFSRRILGKDGRLYHPRHHPPEEEIADWGAMDPQAGVLLFEATDGSGCDVLLNFTAHPVTVQVQPLISADYPGVATGLVEQTLKGSCCLFTQGACGSINPVRNTTDFADVWRYGLTLAGAALQAIGRMSAPDYPAQPARVDVASTHLSLPRRPLPDRAPIQAQYDEFQRKIDAASDPQEKNRLRHQQRLLEETLVLIDFGTAPLEAEVQVLRLGHVALVGLPGEPFCELGLQIKRREREGRAIPGVEYAFCVGYANGWLGYLAPRPAWEQGGYEVSPGPWSLVGPGGAEACVEAGLALVEELWGRP